MNRHKTVINVDIYAEPIRGKISDSDDWVIIVAGMFAAGFSLTIFFVLFYLCLLDNKIYMYFFAVLLFVAGLYLLFHYMKEMFKYRELMIDDDFVRVESRGWTGANVFIEPWINYGGVMFFVTREPSGRDIKNKYEIQLYHGDIKKRIPIYREERKIPVGEDDIKVMERMNKLCKEIAEELDMQVLEPDR